MLMEKNLAEILPARCAGGDQPCHLRTLKELMEKTCAEHADRVAFIQMGCN